jgi:small subunit ribosomal protein S1
VTFTDSSDPINPIEAPANAAENPPAASSPPSEVAAVSGGAADDSAAIERRRILIGSQRDPAAYRARLKRDWTPVDEQAKKPRKKKAFSRAPKGSEEKTAEPFSRAPQGSEGNDQPSPTEGRSEEGMVAGPHPGPLPTNLRSVPGEGTDAGPLAALSPLPSPLSTSPFPRPNLREQLSPELENELSGAMSDASFDQLMGADAVRAEEAAIEPDSLLNGRVIAVRRDDVFVELGSREQGIVSLRQFDVPPQPGALVQVVVQRLNPEDGLYELSLPNKAVQVDDWSDLVEGALVEVRVTGHNTGGLECEVNHIRGFIPISQISLYRVEDLAPFVDQRLTCVIAEADPDRRNLVLSRRAVLEREKEQARQQMLETLRPGQLHEGVVRKLMDFGAFVDIGGVDGLVHVSQLAWGRVKHPSDVLQEGQKIQVRVEKVDPTTGKISLAYRDLLQSPWTDAAGKYPSNSVVKGTVTKLMEFGAFVELEPGVEGLVHISELSPKRVARASDVVHEGDAVEVLVLSIDAEAQRISLSMKALAGALEPAKKEGDAAGEAAAAQPSKKRNKPSGPLLGGLTRPTGDRFGLKW